MNKLRLLLPTALLFFFVNSHAQKVVVDTSKVPLWINMMQDPNANFFKTQRAFELYWQNRPIEKGSGFKPFKRWEYNTYEIIDDQGNIPKAGQLDSIVQDYIKNQYKGGTGGGVQLPGAPNSGPATCLTEGNWIELGPRKLSGNRTSQPNGLGRVNALAFHPSDSNIIYAGTPAGGLWVTTDRGKSWSSNTDTLSTLGISSIAVDPFDHDTIYLGTGDRDAGDASSRGVLRSTDGGKTWHSANTGMGNVVVGRLEADPRNKGVLIAGTSGGIYRSTNHGNNWSRVIAGNFKEMVFGATNSNYIYAATYATAKYYVSTNNGVSFTQVTTGLPTGKRRMVIGVSPHDSNFVYVLTTNSRTFEGMYLSTDKGQTFSQMSNTPNIMDYSTTGSGTGGQAWYDLDIAIDPLDKTVVYVGGVNIFKSTDSGKTWKINAHWVGSGGAPSIHADQHIFEYNPNDNRLYVGNDGGVYYTDNGGQNYYDISEGIGNSQIYRLGQSVKSKDMVINGYQDNGTGLYDNGDWYTIMGGDGMDCVIDPTDDTWAYSDLYYGDVRRFKNGRYNAGIAKNGLNGITESGGWVTPFVLQEGTPKTMFIGYKNVWRSTNCQASPPTWTKISNNVAGSNSQNITYLENSPADPKILYVARSGNKFFKTTDVNAATPAWTDLTSKLPNNAALYWIESHHKKANTVWISQSNKVYQTDDGGNTWTNISNGLPNLRILSIVFDSSSKNEAMYCGTYMGVFYRDSVLKKWVWYNNGMPTYTRVRDIEIYHSPQGRSKSHVICATYGRGNWRSPLYDEDQKAPLAGFEVSDTFNCVGAYFKLSDTSENIPTRWKWEIRPANVAYTNGTDSCSQFPELSFTKAGTYNIKLVAENCVGKDSVEKTAIIRVMDGPKAATCDGITSSLSQRIGIYEVEIDTFKHSSLGARDEGGYLDLSCTELIQLKTDTTYNLKITNGATYAEYLKIFIDFNNNGKLDDAGEWFEGSARAKSHTVQIPIPANATIGQTLRMRIMSDWDTIPANPCDTLRYGQTQDYGLILELREPKPHFTLNTDSVCVGQQVVVTDSSEGSIIDRKWYFGSGASMDSATGLGPFNITYSSPGFKTIRLLVNSGSVEKRIDSVIFVKQSPNLGISLSAGAANGCELRSINLSVHDSNQVASNLSWNRDWIEVKSGSDTFYNIASAVLSDSGSYRVVGEYLGCKDSSDPIDLKVYSMPVVNFTTNGDSQCLNEHQFQFTNTSTLAQGNMTHLWDFGNASTSSNQNPSKTYAAYGLYTVKLTETSDRGCIDSAVKNIRVWANPYADIRVDKTPQCLDGNLFNFRPVDPPISGSIYHRWEFFGDNTVSNVKKPSKKYLSDGKDTVRLIEELPNGCKDTFEMEIEVHPSPNAQFNVNNGTQCFNDQQFDFVNTSSISSGAIVLNAWDMGDLNTRGTQDVMAYAYGSAGTFDVVLEVESDQGCKNDTTIKVTVGESPTADFYIDLSNPCFNEHNVSFTNNSSVNSGSIISQNWDFGDASASISSNPPSKKYPMEGNYVVQLIVETDNGCKDTLEKDFDLYPSPLADFLAGNGCLGESIMFTDMSTLSVGNLNHLYTFEPGKQSADPNPGHTFSSTGTHTVELIVTSDQGCKDTVTKDAVVYQLPSADFAHSKTASSGKTTTMQFTNQSSSDAQQFDWDFDLGGTSVDEHPLVTFSDTGVFIVQLIVTNANGCKDTSNQSVLVFPSTLFHIENSFTPNGDNTNDYFELTGLDFVNEFSLKIYGRWGEQVFESNDPNSKWDGNYQNSQAPAGMYFYVVEFKDLGGKKYQERGELFLIR